MKRLTIAQSKQHKKLWDDFYLARKCVYASVEDRNTVFSVCFDKSSPETQEAYSKAIREVREFEHRMVDEGRGYHNNFGTFYSY